MSNTTDQRGTKRDSTDLLSTNTNHNNTQNPHPPKKSRTSKQKYASTLQSLLQMSPSEIQALPEPLKSQAIALRQKRNIINNTNQPNNTNININAPMPPNLQQPISLISDSDSDTTEYVAPTQQQNVNPINVSTNDNQHPNRYLQNNNNGQPMVFNPNTAFSRGPRISQPQQPQQQTRHVQLGRIGANIPDNATALNYNGQSFQPMQPIVDDNVNSNPNSGSGSYGPRDRYISVQDLMDDENNGKSYCGFCNKLWFIICTILLLMPAFMSIQWKNSYGSNYCDTNKNVILSLNSTKNCIPCPVNAKYCMGGKARCTKHEMVDVEINECVVISYKKNVITAYKNTWNLMVNGCKNVVSYCYNEILKWKSIEEWKNWWERLKNLSLEEFCKQYEMEIMVSFFVLTWNFPMVRLLIICFWSRMVLAMVNNTNDINAPNIVIPNAPPNENIVIGLKLLSYFAPIMFGYVIWDKVSGYFA